MYKILILYNKDHNLWQQYGTTTTTSSVSNCKKSFIEFETDDLEILKEEVLKLDRIYGHDQIRVYKDITANFSVEIVEDDAAESEDVDS